MSDIFDQISAAAAKAGVRPNQAPALPETDGDGSFLRGARSGTLGAGAQLQALAGSVAETAGYKDFADARYAGARDLSQQAQAAAPRITSYKDVGSLSDAGSYVAGMVGQSLPYGVAGLGAAALTGGGAIPAMAAGTAIMTPFEAGDIAQRQQLDPEAMRRTPGERLRAQIIGGAGSAALQSVVPAIMGGKILGKTGAAAAKLGSRQIIGRGLADVGLEGVTEGAGEVAKQGGEMLTNPNRQLDWDAVGENAVGGLAGGVGYAGLGTAGELMHANAHGAKNFIGSAAQRATDGAQSLIGKAQTGAENPGTPAGPDGVDLGGKISNFVGSAKEAATGAAQAVKDAVGPDGFDLGGKTASFVGSAKEAATEAGGALNAAAGVDLGGAKSATKDALGSAADMVGAAVTSAKDKTSSFIDRVAAGEEFMDAKAFVGKTGDALKQAMDGEVSDRAAKVSEWAQGLWNSPLVPETRAKLQAAMSNLGDKASQAYVAGLKQAEDLRNTTQSYVAAFHEGMNTGKAERATDGAKKSEDYGGVDKVVKDTIAPFIRDKMPELMESNDSINQLASGLRQVVSDMVDGKPITSDGFMRLVAVTGDNTADLLSDIHAAISGGDVDSAKAATFFKGLNGLTATQDDHQSLMKVMMDNVAPGEDVNPREMRNAAAGLMKWADTRPNGSTVALTERQKAMDTKIRRELTNWFGDKTDTVLEAASTFGKREENRIEEERPLADGEDGHLLSDRETPAEWSDTRVVTHAKGRVYLNAEDDPGKAGFRPAVTQALEKAQGENPNTAVRYAGFDELGLDHPNARAKHSELIKRGMAADLGDDAAVQYADSEIGKYGMLVSETSNNPLRVTGDELMAAKLDAKKFGRSPARIDAEGVGHPLDAVRLTELMLTRTEKGGVGSQGSTTTEFVGNRLRDARAFMDGIAAVQDYTGHPFEVADSTVISKSGMTWGDAKELDNRTTADKSSDSDTRELVELRRGYKLAKTRLDQDMVREKARDMAGRKESAVMREQAGEDGAGEQQDDPTGFEGSVERGIDVGKAPLKASIAELQSGIAELGRQLDGEQQFGGGRAEVKLRQQLGQLNTQLGELQRRVASRTTNTEDLGTGQQEFDPFGPTFQNGRSIDETGRGEIFSDGDGGGSRRVTLDGTNKALSAPSMTEPRAEPKNLPVPDKRTNAQRLAAQEGSPDPKAVAAKQAAFLERAASGDVALNRELSTSDDAKGLQRAAEALAGKTDANSIKTLDAANERLRTLVQNPDVAYGLLTTKYSMESAERTNPNQQGPKNLKSTFDYIKRVLGNSVSIDLNANIPHAGEFQELINSKGGIEHVIRLSMHALNPLSTAHHEALHAFFAKLRAQQNGLVAGVLEKAAASPSAMMQMREFLKDSPEALAQLSNPEERAAYMYQAWAAGKLKLAGAPKTFFERVGEFIRSTLGIWSNDERALHIMEYFHSGEFAQNIGKPGHVADALIKSGRNDALETFKGMIKPLANLGEQLAVAGHQRLRDTGIPALNELADMMKLQGTGVGNDQGFIPAARQEHARRMNELGSALRDASPEALSAAMEAMQSGDKSMKNVARPEDRLAAREAIKTIRTWLDDAHGYMTAAGVKVNDLGVGKDYFPRVWDTSYISGHQTEFLSMLDKYVQSGEFAGKPKQFLNNLMSSSGNEFTVETDRPGMQFVKPRKLAFIKPADAAEFVNKNLFETLNGYMAQATRRAEWASRFGEHDPALPADRQKPTALDGLMSRARREGATPADMDAARKYLRAVDGTLGDTINPAARRLQGNLMVYQNLRLLPLAIFSSVVDPLGIMVRGGTVGDAFSAFKRGVGEIPKGFKRGSADDESTQLAATLGVIDSAMLAHTLGTSFSQGMVGDTSRKVNDTLFKFNLMEQFNTSMRVAATEAAVGFLGRHAEGDAGPHSARWLAELGMQPGEVRFAPGSKSPMVTEHDGLTAPQAAKMRMAINRWVDGAVLRPDAADAPIWMNDPHFALFSHLKRFAFSFQETVLKRVMHEARAGNYSPAYAMAGYVPVMIAADAAKGLIQGGGSQPAWKRDWGPSEYLWSGVERAGLLGVGQYGADALGDIKHGGSAFSALGTLTGPTIEQLSDAVQVMGGRREFGSFALRSMPANALYSGLLPSAGAAGAPPRDTPD